jgi:predicted acylesterase/phospholipase RssA
MFHYKVIRMVKHLVFAGGGIRCVSFIGSLEVLAKHNLLNDTKHYWGNSAGALVATCLSLKTPLSKLRTIFESTDFTKFRDFDLANLMSIGTSWGMDSGMSFVKSLKNILEDIKPGSSQYTLQEIPELHITATDLTDTKPVILDSKSYPTLKLIDALRASTSIPFFYTPFRNPIDNHLLIDGAVVCNFPWILLPKDIDLNDAIGFDFQSFDPSKEPSNFSEFIPTILNFKDTYWRSEKLKPKHPNIIRFDVRDFPAWHFGLDLKDRNELTKIGASTTENWLTSRSVKETEQTNRVSAPQNTPELTPPSGCTGEVSESHERCSSHKVPCLHQRPRQLLKPSCRRWSL